MNQNDRFDDILNECLDRILRGETVDQCLQSYPEQAGELEPLLRTALAAKTASHIQPRPEFRARARYEFQSALRDMEARKSRRRSFLNWHWQWQWQSGWAIAMIAVLVIVIAGGSTVAASRNSMPDEFLYPVKITAENVQLALTPSEVGKAELNARYAEKRAEEIVYMVAQDNPQDVQAVAQLMNDNLRNINTLIEKEAVRDGVAGNNAYDMSRAPVETDEPRIMMGASATTPTPDPESEPISIFSMPPEPSDTPAPAPLPAASQAPAPAPAPGVGPTSDVMPEQKAESVVSNLQASDDSEMDKWERIRQIITENFGVRHERLQEALNTAPPEVQPAILEAIEQSIAEYERALRNLELVRNTR